MYLLRQFKLSALLSAAASSCRLWLVDLCATAAGEGEGLIGSDCTQAVCFWFSPPFTLLSTLYPPLSLLCLFPPPFFLSFPFCLSHIFCDIAFVVEFNNNNIISYLADTCIQSDLRLIRLAGDNPSSSNVGLRVLLKVLPSLHLALNHRPSGSLSCTLATELQLRVKYWFNSPQCRSAART